MYKLVVFACLLALAYSKPAFYSPLGYPLAYSYPAPIVAGPLSLAPGQPASILGADGRPLDTLDVNIAKAQHYSAKAFDGIHLLKKRSIATYVAPISAPLITHAHTPALPITYHAPLTYTATAPLTYPYPTYFHY